MSDAERPALVAVDWGTSRFRAFLLDADGAVLGRLAADDGIVQVPAGGFPDVLMRHCGPWLQASPAIPVLMAGMVGSRNGWVEAPYATAPAGLSSLAKAMISLKRPDGGEAYIVPGVSGVFDRAGDVMRGEETLIFGLGLDDALVCLPGTHSKWVSLRHGRIDRFATFMTGEIYAALMQHTILGRLSATPQKPSGFLKGIEAADRSPYLTHELFQARADVLLGRLEGAEVAPFISGSLIGHEVNGACVLFPNDETVVLISEGCSDDIVPAEGTLAGNYHVAISEAGYTVRPVSPETALIGGLLRMGAAAGLLRAPADS